MLFANTTASYASYAPLCPGSLLYPLVAMRDAIFARAACSSAYGRLVTFFGCSLYRILHVEFLVAFKAHDSVLR